MTKDRKISPSEYSFSKHTIPKIHCKYPPNKSVYGRVVSYTFKFPLSVPSFSVASRGAGNTRAFREKYREAQSKESPGSDITRPRSLSGRISPTKALPVYKGRNLRQPGYTEYPLSDLSSFRWTPLRFPFAGRCFPDTFRFFRDSDGELFLPRLGEMLLSGCEKDLASRVTIFW